MDDDYTWHRKQYEQRIETAIDAAVNACTKVLKTIGIHANDKLEDALHQAIL